MIKSFLNKVKENIKKRDHIYVPDIHPRPGISLNRSYFTDKYLYRRKRKVFFAVSSGFCNLNCPYCITNRPRFRDHLTKDDFAFIFDYFGENIYFGFSGLGDFFCGYSPKDQLLRFLLQHDVMIYLDINGVEIHELGDTALENKEKIGLINVSYHYGTMKKQRLINRWLRSMEMIQGNTYNYELKMVVSPGEKEVFEEAIRFYRNEVQPVTGRKLVLVPDGLVSLESQSGELARIADIYGDSVVFTGKDAFFREKLLPPADTRRCPAGSRYFRIFNNGDIIPCELFGTHMDFKLGNSGRKEMTTIKNDIYCNYSDFCDCSAAIFPGAGLLDKKGRPYQ